MCEYFSDCIFPANTIMQSRPSCTTGLYKHKPLTCLHDIKGIPSHSPLATFPLARTPTPTSLQIFHSHSFYVFSKPSSHKQPSANTTRKPFRLILYSHPIKLIHTLLIRSVIPLGLQFTVSDFSHHRSDILVLCPNCYLVIFP